MAVFHPLKTLDGLLDLQCVCGFGAGPGFKGEVGPNGLRLHEAVYIVWGKRVRQIPERKAGRHGSPKHFQMRPPLYIYMCVYIYICITQPL